MKKSKRIPISPLSIATECLNITQIWMKHGVFGFPFSLVKGVGESTFWDAGTIRMSVYRELGSRLLRMFSDLGPVYGKAFQIFLSRVDLNNSKSLQAMQLSDIYGNWPALPFEEIENILDEEIPEWRSELEVERIPLGCASIAQVHSATDSNGKKWVLKIVRPDSEKRLHQTVNATLALLDFYRPLAVTKNSQRVIHEIKSLCQGLQTELDLEKERQTIQKIQVKMTDRKKSIVRIPEIHETLHSSKVLVVERFEGVKLSDVAAGKVELSRDMRQKLARKMLKELLIQVFEFGLFHGDPHAGNLMLLEDGAIGLFDWGLSGELLESDRAHIASMLRAVMAMDLDQLAEVLKQMGDSEGKKISTAKIKKELSKVSALVKKKQQDGEKVSLHDLINSCLAASQKLDLHVPDGLLMMAKSLITIEGLAKGIDPDVRLGAVASPFLLKAARPRLADFIQLGAKAPKILMKMVMER